MKFTGFCTYPHGGYASAGMLASSIAALTATTYAVCSCRFVTVTFRTTHGYFDEQFGMYGDSSNNVGTDTTGTTIEYHMAAGLFQWLRPNNITTWHEGSCAGYQQSMLNALEDSSFDIARGMAVFAVILAVVVTVWTFLNACVQWQRLQLWLLRMLVMGGAVCSGCTLLVTQSTLCVDLFDGSTSCAFDEGGLIMVAAIILWFCAVILSCVFIRDPDAHRAAKYHADDADRDIDKREVDRLAAQLTTQRQQWDRARQQRERAENLHYQERRHHSQPQLESGAILSGNAPRATQQHHRRTHSSDNPAVAAAAAAARVIAPKTSSSHASRPSTSVPSSLSSSWQPRRQQQQQQQPGNKEASRPVRKERLTVDDITSAEQLEVYIARRLDKIENLCDV